MDTLNLTKIKNFCSLKDGHRGNIQVADWDNICRHI